MAEIFNSRCVLAVRDLDLSTRYYMDVLGFRKDRSPSATRLSLSMHFGEPVAVSL